MTDFVHLHCHSEFSMKNSTIRVPGLVKQAKEMGMTALAVTDENNLFAAVKFYNAAIKAKIKPIFGAEITLGDEKNKYKLLLLCQDKTGYQNLCELISEGFLAHQYLGEVIIPVELLCKHNQGLIAIANPVKSDVAQLLLHNKDEKAREKLAFWQEVFGNRYYLAIQRTQQTQDEQHLQLTVKLALETKTPVVATNAVQFLQPEDFEAHEVRVCVASGDLLDDDNRVRAFSEEQYFKSPENMAELFDDLPEAIQNSANISQRCNLKFSLYEKNYLPIFPTPEGMSVADFFAQESQAGLDKIINSPSFEHEQADIYQDRLDYEVGVIQKMDFPGYFLIVADFIAYAKAQKIPVGPGRGSGAGSLVAYCLGITQVDPIYHDLLFERFLNPERVSMPDFDIDFCTDGRDEVIAYVAKTYGQEKVSQIATHGTMAAKGVVRDVGRVLGHPYGFSDSLAKAIPNELKITLSKALGDFGEIKKDASLDEIKKEKETRNKLFSPEIKAKYDSNEAVKAVIDLGLSLEGLARNVGTHAGGVVIAQSKISDYCPFYKGPNDKDSIVAQFDMNDLEAVGLVKFDFLGLSNLTVIDKTLNELHRQKITKNRIDLNALSLDDKKVYDLLKKGDTTGIFQLESPGMRTYLKDLEPDSFADIVAMLALYRPGPLESGMVEEYIDVKRNRKSVEYPHPMLEETLKPTNGGFLYQEQVMQAAQVMAGYSLGGADILRRAMGKKKAEEMKKQRSVFVTGATKNGVDEKKADEIFDLIDKFSGYGFNKSHSVAYALVSYQTAYLKAHYLVFFMAAVLTGVMADTDRVAFIMSEVKKSGISVIAPSVNLSHSNFAVVDGKIVYGLGAVKGAGQALAQEIVAQRTAGGSFKDLVDYCCRLDKKYLNRRALEALILCGAFDEMSNNRNELFHTFPLAVKQAEQYQRDLASGQQGLFTQEVSVVSYQDIVVKMPKLTAEADLAKEKKMLGYFFSAHPMQFYQTQAKKVGAGLPKNFKKRANSPVRILGMVSDFRFQESAQGRIAMMNLEDEEQTLFTIFSTEAAANFIKMDDDQIVIVDGKLRQNFKKDAWQIRADKLTLLSDALTDKIQNLSIHLDKEDEKHLNSLAKLLAENPGNCPTYLHYTQKNQATNLTGAMKIKSSKPTTELQKTLVDCLGQHKVVVS